MVLVRQNLKRWNFETGLSVQRFYPVGGSWKSQQAMGADNQNLSQQPNNSLKRTENGRTASPRDLTAPRITSQWTRGRTALIYIRSAAA